MQRLGTRDEPKDLTVPDIVEPPPSTARMVGRAILLRCPRCGSGGQFRYWVKRADHCPGCGYTLDRENDSFFGAFLINLCVTFAALFGLLIAMVIFEAAERPLPVVPLIGVGLFIAVILPLLFYPFAFTLWVIIDLHSDPLRMSEIVDAADRVAPVSEEREPKAGTCPTE